MEKRLVTPGEVVGYAEEFDTSGAVYSVGYRYIAAAVGVALFDKNTHLASVRPFREAALPPQGAVVYCVVTGKGRRAYTLKCFAVERGQRPVDLRYQVAGVLPHVFTDGGLGVGDYIRGKVVSTYGPPLVVSIRGHTYGAVLSRCPRCGSVLKRRGMSLYCPSCGTEARRKVAVGYYMM
ncbi:MAG: exosome complex RNA-binding protein Csl4 [Pyrobaculum sp.]